MNAQEFVDAIQVVVLDKTGPGTLENLRRPPGRRPAAELVELSRWFNGLSVDDRAMIERLLRMTVRDSVHMLFSVLDGAIKVDPAWQPGDHFELRHVRGETVEVLSGRGGTPLHELL